MKRRVISVLLAAAMVATMVAGCGGTKTPTDDNKDGENKGGEVTAKEITYWSMWNSTENQAKVIQEAADAYTAKTGVKVKIEWKGRDVKTMIGAALDAGEKIDLYDDDFQRVVQQQGDKMADITDMAAAAGYESHVLPVLLSQAKEWGGGVLKVLPYQPYITGVWYNKDAWADAGLTDADEPATWADFQTVLKKIKDHGKYNPITCDSDFVNLLYGFQLARYIGQDGVMDCINNCTWSEKPEALKAAEEIQSLFKNGYMSQYAPANGTDGQSEIGYGESVMVLQASWVPNEIIQTTGEAVNWGFFPWPAVEGGVDGTEASMVGSQGFGIVAASENKQEAFDFALTVVTGEYDLKMAEGTSSIPADTANTAWPSVIGDARDSFVAMSKTYQWAVGFQSNADYSTGLQENLLGLATQSLTPQAFVDACSALGGN